MKNGVLLLAPEGPAVEPVDGNTLAVQSTPIKGKPTTQAPEDPAMEPVDESTLCNQHQLNGCSPLRVKGQQENKQKRHDRHQNMLCCGGSMNMIC